MKGDSSCQVSQMLPPPGYIFQRSQRRTECVAQQNRVAPEALRALMDGWAGAQCYTVNLGDEVLRYDSSIWAVGDLYVVATGSVRLMATNATLQRTVSVAKLGPGQAFGLDGQAAWLWADRAIWPQVLPYWARAAAPSHIVRIPAGAMATVLDRWPALRGLLQHQFQQRSSLAFFKQLTPLGAVPSTLLVEHLLPYLMEYSLRAGSSLAQVPWSPTDCLWLRQGQLFNGQCPEQVMAAGDRWGAVGGMALQADWVAKTDSLLYRLPLAPHADVA